MKRSIPVPGIVYFQFDDKFSSSLLNFFYLCNIIILPCLNRHSSNLHIQMDRDS